MNTAYKPNYFTIDEYVPESVYRKYGTDSIWFINPRLMKMDDLLREHFGVPVYINSWSVGGSNHFRGFRPADCTVGALHSQHRLGNASDKTFKGLDPIEIQQEIILNKAKFPYITAIEIGVNWVHTDVRPTTEISIIEFDSSGKRIKK